LDYTAAGQPVWPGSGLHFNVAHSGALALVAISASVPVGVDVEWRRDVDVDGLAAQVLGEHERRLLSQAPPALRQETFYRYWVCKEAALKAVGRGLPYGLHRIEVRPDGVYDPHRIEVRADCVHGRHRVEARPDGVAAHAGAARQSNIRELAMPPAACHEGSLLPDACVIHAADSAVPAGDPLRALRLRLLPLPPGYTGAVAWASGAPSG
jgi:4'-phosphopantetheinyl transferase